MDCQRIEELLSPFTDGELPVDLARRVLSHLDACAHCRAEADALRCLSSAIDAVRAPAPLGMAASILSQARISAGSADGLAGGKANVLLRKLRVLGPRVAAMLVGAAAATLLMSRLISPAPGDGSSSEAPRTPFQILVAESQAGLELGGSFRGDCSALAARPEGRLIHELTGGR